MPISDYVCSDDFFEEEENGYVNNLLCFPCKCCQHQSIENYEAPCVNCGHNANHK